MKVRGQRKMASNTTRTVFVLFLTNLFETVCSYYCNNDKCLEEEFCCGENICCVSYKVWELWYFWCGILFCLLLLSLCACFWRHRSRAYWVFRAPVPYSPLSVEDDPNFNPSHADPYIGQKDHVLPPGQFYGHSQDQPTWYRDQHRDATNVITQTYTDREQFYDSGPQKKSEY